MQGFDAMLSQLTLTDKQQAEVDKLREKMNAAAEKNQGNQDATRQATQEFRTKVLALLTPEQRKKLDEARAQHRGGSDRGGHGRHRGGGQGGQTQ